MLRLAEPLVRSGRPFRSLDAREEVLEGGPRSARRVRRGPEYEVVALYGQGNVVGRVDRQRAPQSLGLLRRTAGSAGLDRYFDPADFFGWGGAFPPSFGWAPGPRLSASETMGAVWVRRATSSSARSLRYRRTDGQIVSSSRCLFSKLCWPMNWV